MIFCQCYQGTALPLRAQFYVEIESTARCDFGVDGHPHGPSIPDRDHDPKFEIRPSVNAAWVPYYPCVQNFALKSKLLSTAISALIGVVHRLPTVTVTLSVKCDPLSKLPGYPTTPARAISRLIRRYCAPRFRRRWASSINSCS